MNARKIFGILAIVSALGACSTRRSEPFTGAVPSGNPRLDRGRIAFAQHCYKCHPGGEGGLGPAINDKPLPEFLIKMQVRVGLGAMPSFHRADLSDADLDALVHYLKVLRGQRVSR
jgi:mono/diheme cytochrome c family protein